MIYKRIGQQLTSLKCYFLTVSETPESNLCGMVAELKMEDETSSPIWECFHNMSAVGASLVMKALSQGVLINQVIIYGIVGIIDESLSARLIKLYMNLEHGICAFQECDGKFHLSTVLNVTLAHIA